MGPWKTYNELMQLPTFEERFAYLQTHSRVGDATFGGNRIFNQDFYQRSKEWQAARATAIRRDTIGKYTCDLGCPDRPIVGMIFVHHINPITMEMLENHDPALFDPDNLICTSSDTHNDLHYGYKPRNSDWKPRTENDTCPWKKVTADAQ